VAGLKVITNLNYLSILPSILENCSVLWCFTISQREERDTIAETPTPLPRFLTSHQCAACLSKLRLALIRFISMKNGFFAWITSSWPCGSSCFPDQLGFRDKAATSDCYPTIASDRIRWSPTPPQFLWPLLARHVIRNRSLRLHLSISLLTIKDMPQFTLKQAILVLDFLVESLVNEGNGKCPSL